VVVTFSVSARAFGMEARQMLYPAVVRTLEQYDPARVGALIATTQQIRRRWLMPALIAVSAKPKRFRSRAPVHPAPLSGRDAHLVLKRALEGGLGYRQARRRRRSTCPMP
jgi:hypothetical protein